MQAVGFGAHADVPCRDAGTDNDLSEVGIGDDSFGSHCCISVQEFLQKPPHHGFS